MANVSKNIIVDPDRLMLAIGRNATHPEDIEGTSDEQKAIAEITAKALLSLTMLDNELIITHGKGPVVGKILMRQTLTRDRITPMPLDIYVAHSQGDISYLLMQTMKNTLSEQSNQPHFTCLLTQDEVDPDDPAFTDPSKPTGPFFREEEAKKIDSELDLLMKKDACRGWRHMEPSPKSQHVHYISEIQILTRRNTVVIASGGRGIPYVRSPSAKREKWNVHCPLC